MKATNEEIVPDSSNEVTLTSPSGTIISSETGIHFRRAGGRRAQPQQEPPIRSARRSTLRSALRECENALDRILNNRHDMVLASNSFDQFQANLDDLWAMRTDFGCDYAETINTLQNLTCGRSRKSFTDPEVEALRSAFRKMQDTDEIDEDIANEITEILLKGGLDVFRELD